MADPIASFSGLSSGIQWRDMVDQIMKAEQARRLDPVASRQAALLARADAWKQFEGVASAFRDAANALSATSAFDVFTANATKSATGRDVISVLAGASAAPGAYSVEVLATARSEKLGGAIVADAAAALGLSGTFSLNGRAITVTGTDTLASVRDKINAVNNGPTGSGVSATILSAGGGARLVLTSDTTGAAGITTLDDGTGLLDSLGFTGGSAVANIDASGATQTNRVSSGTAAIATMLGIPLPTPSTIRVGGYTIPIDLSVDSLTTVAARINAATGASSARVASETNGSTTSYRLVTDATVEVDTGSPADSARLLTALGFTKPGRDDVAQTVLSANTFVDSATSSPATGTSLATNLTVNGQSLGIVDGDTITINGTRGDGSAVTRTLTITATTTVQDLLTAVGDAGTGFGAGTRPASASLVNGRISLTDSIGGDSRLGMQLAVKHADGSTVSLGAFGTTNGGTTGRNRQIAAGSDAMLRIDGQLVQRSSNTVTDAIAGVTLTAMTAEPGSTSVVSVNRDLDGAAKVAQNFVSAYNAVRTFITKNSAVGGPLANTTALRTMGSTLTTQLLTDVIGANASLTTAALAGMQHDRNGVLSLDAGVFKGALQSNLAGVRALFSSNGVATDPEVSYVSNSDLTTPGASPYAIAITQAATFASVTGSSWTTYATAGTPDSMTITDAATGTSRSITLANGDSIDTVLGRLNTEFSAGKMHLRAERTVDDRLTITSTDFGAEGGFSVAFTPGSADGTAQLGFAAQAYTGLDVAGTIDGKAATGRGQILTSSTGAANGLAIRYTGALARAAGTVSFGLGVGGMLARAASSITSAGSASASAQESSSRTQADALDSRILDIQSSLDARRQAMIRQFIAMESALSKAQSIGSFLSAQVNALSGNR